jgi:general stress protein 26
MNVKEIERVAGNLIDSQKISIISSIDSDGFPNTTAMLQPRKREGIKTIYYSTNTSSNKVLNFIANSKACVYFFDSQSFEGVMLIGSIEIINDFTIKEMLWRDGDTLFYPLGIEDPDYCVLKFTTKKGRYYSSLKTEKFDIE